MLSYITLNFVYLLDCVTLHSTYIIYINMMFDDNFYGYSLVDAKQLLATELLALINVMMNLIRYIAPC